MTGPAAPAGTRRSSAKHKAILRAATEVFLREGYARASVDSIAAAAGVGKQTVYGHFGNKQQLFLAVVEEAREAAGVNPDTDDVVITDSGDTRADLQATGERLLRAMLEPENAALHRLTIAELTHHPELMRGWRDDSGSEALIGVVADFLGTREDLRVDDPKLSARQFIMLLSAEGQVRSLRGVQPLSEDQIREIARETTDLIIRAHRP
jgi:TetR/AcrR family transcriptional regulator, mexJK operon transcriptional repressor